MLPGDEVLADRGFTITDILPPGVKLSIPAFTRGFKDRVLPEESVTETRRIANVHIHVERAIRRLKCFKILSSVIPASVQNVDDILIVCAGLCNLQPLLIGENNCQEEHEYDNEEDNDNDLGGATKEHENDHEEEEKVQHQLSHLSLSSSLSSPSLALSSSLTSSSSS